MWIRISCPNWGLCSVYGVGPESDALLCQSTDLCEKEDEMSIFPALGQFFVGVGLLLIGCAAIWFVAIYSEKK